MNPDFPPEPPGPANAPFPPPPEAEFVVEVAGVRLVLSWLSARFVKIALAADRAQVAHLAAAGAGRTLAGVAYTFEEIAEAYAAAPPTPAPLAAIAELGDAETAEGPGAALFNLIWPQICERIEKDAIDPPSVMAALCAMVARGISSVPADEQDDTYRAFCHNLGRMINAENRLAERKRKAH